MQLLSYRRADILNSHAEALRGLTATSTAQSASLRDLTEKTRMDSRCMRILTFIALMYLPANLIAVRPCPPYLAAPESHALKSTPLTIWLLAVHFLRRLGADSSCSDGRGPQRASCATRLMGICVGEYCADGIDASLRGSLGPQEWMAAYFGMETIEACA